MIFIGMLSLYRNSKGCIGAQVAYREVIEVKINILGTQLSGLYSEVLSANKSKLIAKKPIGPNHASGP